jgi:CTP:molybdopterin cytidylyltransferase MocA
VLFGARPALTLARPFSSAPPVELHVDALKRAGVDQIALVTGAGGNSAAARMKDVRVVLHSGAWNSSFDEIVLGLFALERAPVLVLPANHELISDETLRLLVSEAQAETASHAVVPFHGERPGYPVVLFQAGVDAAIREAALPYGVHQLDALLQSWRDGVRTLPVTDESVTEELTARA